MQNLPVGSIGVSTAADPVATALAKANECHHIAKEYVGFSSSHFYCSKCQAKLDSGDKSVKALQDLQRRAQ